jgi:MFS family permease
MPDVPPAVKRCIFLRVRRLSTRAVSFLKRQQRDWKVTVERTSLERFAYQIVFPYLSIYIISLGATATQLGMVTSFGMIAAGLISPFIGWFIDKTGPKKIYLFGISLLALSYLFYGLAQGWAITILAMMAYWLGFSISLHSCATICGNCLVNEDRATGMMICETVGAGLLGMAGPLMGMWLVTFFGGVNTPGIRPLFFFSLIITLGSFFVVWTQLSATRRRPRFVAHANIFHDLYRVLQDGKQLKRWLVISSVGQLPVSMVFPFSQVFAHEIKGADQFILGAMVTGSALTSIILAIPLGRLADRVGRKKVLYFMIPLFWIANLLLLWSPSPVFLLAAGVMQGFYFLAAPISAAMERELVPPEKMGRWLGIARFIRLLLNALFAFAAGILWDRIGPQYVFVTFILIDLAVRAPLLWGMKETLHLQIGKEIPAGSK